MRLALLTLDPKGKGREPIRLYPVSKFQNTTHETIPSVCTWADSTIISKHYQGGAGDEYWSIFTKGREGRGRIGKDWITGNQEVQEMMKTSNADK